MRTETYTINLNKEEEKLIGLALAVGYQPMNDARLKDQILREARAVIRRHVDDVVDSSRRQAAWLAEQNIRAIKG